MELTGVAKSAISRGNKATPYWVLACKKENFSVNEFGKDIINETKI